MLSFIRRTVPWFLGFCVLSLDVLSKYITTLYLPLMHAGALKYPYGGVGVFKNFLGIEFSFSHQINHGAAWGLFAEYQIPLLFLRLALILALVIYVLSCVKQMRAQVAFALVIAGALGNVVDYFVYGHVVDMLHFVLWGYDFPVFNLADTAIFLGVTGLVLTSSDTHPSASNSKSLDHIHEP